MKWIELEEYHVSKNTGQGSFKKILINPDMIAGISEPQYEEYEGKMCVLIFQNGNRTFIKGTVEGIKNKLVP